MELFNSSSTGQFILDNRGTVLRANSSFNSMIKQSDIKAVVGTKLVDIINSDDRDKWLNTFKSFYTEGNTNSSINIRYNSEDDISWWKLSLDKVTIGNKSLILCVAVDIKEEIESQGDLLEAKKAAEKSEASKSIFLANMSHEIRTPIHTVTGLAELLGDTELDGEQSEYVSQIDFAAKVLLTLINDILDFSKIEAGKLTFENIEYNLYETIINSVDLSALEAHRKGVDVAISMDADMPTNIIGDQVRLRQVIVNLMSNAVKFTKQGEIILDISTKIVDKDNVVLRISVTDSGIGISKDKQSRLFKAFSQADASTTRQFGGTGLGLSISSSLVQMMGGTMAVESEDGEGSSFFFEIPVKTGIELPKRYKKPPIAELKVLVVDDNIKVNKIFSDILRSWNYNVVEVYSSLDALDELNKKATIGEPYDLCFIDQILPGMDGWQLASEIHSSSLIKTTKTLLMSLKGKGIEESKMKLLGWFQGYLTKPVTIEDLYKALDELYSRTQEVNLGDSLEDDEIEELESLGDEDLDEEYMEPLKFSDSIMDELEELIPLEEDAYDIKKKFSKKPKKVENIVKNILVVEDHLVNQKLFRIILEKAGHNVYVAADGLEALEIVESTTLDLVFMDCQMPVMNGYDSSELMRAKGYTLPIVAVTASAVKGEYEKCINSGMSDVMTKPFKKEDVMASLEKWLDQGNNRDRKMFDYENALERFMGEKEILLEVLLPYIENLDKCLNELKTLDGTQCTRIRELAHSIKGSSLNLDILPLGEEAESLEDLAYNNVTAGMDQKISNLLEIAALTESELRKYLD
ncbi:MAG: response regulator [Spirochaetaceae bacterium]